MEHKRTPSLEPIPSGWMALAPFGGFLLLVGYSTGFLISNYHLSRLIVLDYSLLQGRYVAAALLFFLMGGPALAAGVLSGRLLFRRTLVHLGRRVSLGLLSLLVAISIDALIWANAFVSEIPGLQRLIPGTQDNPQLISFVGLAVASGLSAALLMQRIDRAAVEFRKGGILLLGLFALGAYLLLAAWFAAGVYPFVAPGYGGGALWVARITLKEGRVPGYVSFGGEEEKIDTASMRVAIAFLDNQRMTFVTCVGSGAHGTLEPTTVSRDQVRRIVIDRPFIVLPQYGFSWYACGNSGVR